MWPNLRCRYFRHCVDIKEPDTNFLEISGKLDNYWLCVENKMRNIFDEIEQKKRAIWLVAIFLVTYNILRLFSIVSSPHLIAVGVSVSEYKTAFQNYINEESERLQMPPDSLKTTILYSGCMAATYIVLSLFLGMRKKFAKYIILSLILVEILMDIVVGIKYSILPSKISILTAIFLFLFLFSHNISKELK